MVNKLYLMVLLSGVGIMPQALGGSSDQPVDLVSTVNFDEGVIAPGAKVGLLACRERLDQSLEAGDLVGARVYLGLLATMLGSGGEVQYALPGQGARSIRVASLVIGQTTDQLDLILNQVFKVGFEKLNRYSLTRKQSAIDNFVFQAKRLLKFQSPNNCSIKKIKLLLGRSVFEVPFKIRFVKAWLKVAVISMVVCACHVIFLGTWVGLFFAINSFSGFPLWAVPVCGLMIAVSPGVLLTAYIYAWWDGREDRD